MRAIFCALGFALLTQSATATPLTLTTGSGSDFDAATRCIFNGGGVAGCPMLVGSSGSAPANTPAGAPGASYNSDSWTYTVGEIITALSGDNLFNIVIDSNWAGSSPGDSEFLDVFQVYVNGVVEFDYLGGAAMDSGANGTGNENFLLSTIDFSTFSLTDTAYFHLEMRNLTDGAEQLALQAAGRVGPPPAMPEPGILLLLGTGLLGMALARRITI